MGLFGDSEPGQVQVAGVPLQCEICKNDSFWEREAQLNTAVATFFGFDWANATANCYVCSRCGYIHWFLPQ
jgi:predicted nucleic-acid-binding Zn-ribbon protein